jgi:hypothetical protein
MIEHLLDEEISLLFDNPAQILSKDLHFVTEDFILSVKRMLNQIVQIVSTPQIDIHTYTYSPEVFTPEHLYPVDIGYDLVIGPFSQEIALSDRESIVAGKMFCQDIRNGTGESDCPEVVGCIFYSVSRVTEDDL